MTKISTNLKLDEPVKQAMTTMAKDMGLSLSSLANMTFKQMINNPPYLVLDSSLPVEKMDQATEKELDEIYKEIDAGQVSPVFTDIDSFLADLKSDSR